MSIFHEFESMKYRFILDLIKNEEQYDKKRSVITAFDAYNMCYERFQLMQEVFIPLKKKLGSKVDVTDISFIDSGDEEEGIIVKYLKDGKQYFISISNIGDVDISIVASDTRLQKEDFVEVNRGIILNTFKDIRYNSLDTDILLKSTSGKVVISDNCDCFNISDPDKKILSIEGKYSVYDKTKSLTNSINLSCNYSKLRELLLNEENLLALYQHIHIYENDFPKELTKKLTNR